MAALRDVLLSLPSCPLCCCLSPIMFVPCLFCYHVVLLPCYVVLGLSLCCVVSLVVVCVNVLVYSDEPVTWLPPAIYHSSCPINQDIIARPGFKYYLRSFISSFFNIFFYPFFSPISWYPIGCYSLVSSLQLLYGLGRGEGLEPCVLRSTTQPSRTAS